MSRVYRFFLEFPEILDSGRICTIRNKE